MKTESDIFGFDFAIAYPKGAWVIAMFEQFLGRDAFRTEYTRLCAAQVAAQRESSAAFFAASSRR